MAQELSDKIRAAAQAKGIDPEVALRIAQAESSFNPAAKARTSTAGGLFQVIDDTWKQYGGKPGKKFDPDENIRVGTDIIADNTKYLQTVLGRAPNPAEIYAAHYFGPSKAKAFLAADPSTPISDILPAKAIKANPNLQGKTAGQVLAQLEGKVGGSAKQPAVSRETPPARTPAEEIMEPALKSGMTAKASGVSRETQLASLGPSYQAALALSFLADEDKTPGEKDIDNEPSVAEQWLAQTAPKPTLSMADISIKSPFGNTQAPVMMNEGGDVSTAAKMLREVVPMDLRTFGSTLLGSREPITEANFNPKELAAMQQAVDQAAARTGRPQKGTVQYVDYPRGEQIGPDYQPVGATLGRFSYEKQPDGTTVIRDRYDFYNEGRKENVEAYEKMGRGERAATVAGRMLKNLVTGDLRGVPNELADAYIGRQGRDVTIKLPVKRADGSPEGGEEADLTRPATVNPMIRRQGEAARRLAAMRDVNALRDPRTYAAVTGFFGVAPDEQGFSALHPDIEGVKKAGEAGFYAGTAAQVAPIAGQAAKMLGKLTGSELNKRLLAGQSLTPGISTPAPIAFAVKPRGGHFELAGQTYGAPGDFSKPIDSVQNYVNSHLAITNDHPLNEWLRSKVGSYIRRDMGTEMDQFVKAADEGKKLHFVSKPIGEDYTGPHIPGWLRQARKAEGFPEEGVAKTPYGQKVEMLTDRAVDPIMLEDAYPTTVPPGIKQFVETDPTMRMYGINSTQLEELQLPELRNKMSQMRKMPDSLSFYGQPAVKVPERYMFTDQTLQGLTPAQASERVAQFDTWKQEAKQKMASRAAFDDPNISRSPAENGSVWLNPPDLEKNPAIRELIQDVGCDGGWCTNKESMALSNGSGNNRLTVLLDKNARPKAQMTITTIAPDTDDFLLSMNDIEAQAFKEAYPDVARYDARAIRNTPEYQAWSKINPDGMAITEVKGINNEVDLVNEPYIKQIQDRVKQLDAQFDLKSVDNLDGIGLTEISRDSPYDMLNHFSLPTMTRNSYGDSVGTRMLLKDKFGSEKEGLQAILDEAIKMNGGSKYFSGNEDEISDLFHRATGNILGPEGRATGGLIERRLDDSRKYL